MSKAGRLWLVGIAVVVVAAAFVIANPGDDEDGASTTASQTETSPTATARSAPPPPPAEPPVTRIELKGHEVVGDVASIEVAKGDQVRLVVTSDQSDDIHIHGYDLEKPVGPGSPARFSFPATIEGIFEIESHEAEHIGADPLIARLVVEPS